MENINKTISGPTNAVRLEGNIFGIDKVLYIFFDFHASCTRETRCEDVFSDTITTFLIKEFRKAGKRTLDFFLETYPTWIMQTDILRSIYIMELRKLIAQAFSYNPKEDKVYPSKIFPQVRLHYIDIRDYLFMDILFDQSVNIINMFENLLNYVLCQRNFLVEKDFVYIRSELNRLKDNISMIKELFFKQTDEQHRKIIREQRKIIRQPEEQISDEERRKNTIYLIDKIKTKYKHKEIQEVISKMLNKYFLESLNSILSGIDKVFKSLEYFSKISSINYNELNPEVYKISQIKIPEYTITFNYGPNFDEIRTQFLNINIMIHSIFNICMSASTILVDTFFLRRFLDKDYITNGISYTGGDHSLMYIHILTKYFDFKITHASYSKCNIDELNKKIKNIELGADFAALFSPPKLIQCSNLSSFPEGFK